MKRPVFIAAFILFMCAVLAIPCQAQYTNPPLTIAGLVPSYTVAAKPTGVVGLMIYITDGTSSTDCTTGGGSTKVLCIYNGSAYASVGSAGAGDIESVGNCTSGACDGTTMSWGDGTGPVVWTFSVTGTDATMSITADAFTLNTDLALGANDLTLTGSIGTTGARVTKGWLTDLEITNAPTINGAAWTTILQPLHASLTSISGLTETNGGIPYGTADNTYAWLAAGATGKLLIAKGAAAPEWTPYTMPAAVPTVGYGLISDGTDMVATSSAFGTGAYATIANYQPVDATLTSLAALTIAEGTLIIGSGADAVTNLAKADQYYILTMGAARPEWSNTMQIGTLVLPYSDAAPSATGQIRHDTSVTGFTHGAISWYDGTGVRNVCDSEFCKIDSTGQMQFGDSGTYINQSTDGTLNIVADTIAQIVAPNLKLAFDAATYLNIATADGGATTISQVSDGADTINIGDNTDDQVRLRLVNTDTDGHWSGTTIYFAQCAASMAFGTAAYIQSTGKPGLADADAAATMPAIGLVVIASTDADTPCTILTHGTITKDTWAWTAGNTIYVADGATSGLLTATVGDLSDTDDVVQVVGIALTDDSIFVNPSLSTITLE